MWRLEIREDGGWGPTWRPGVHPTIDEASVFEGYRVRVTLMLLLSDLICGLLPVLALNSGVYQRCVSDWNFWHFCWGPSYNNTNTRLKLTWEMPKCATQLCQIGWEGSVRVPVKSSLLFWPAPISQRSRWRIMIIVSKLLGPTVWPPSKPKHQRKEVRGFSFSCIPSLKTQLFPSLFILA